MFVPQAEFAGFHYQGQTTVYALNGFFLFLWGHHGACKTMKFLYQIPQKPKTYYLGKFSIERQTELNNISLIFKGFTQKNSTFLITARAKSQTDDSKKECPTVKRPMAKNYMCQFR